MKKFFNEFKVFISRGNIVDLAVGIIIGAAFTAIVNSLVKDIIMPLIGLLLGGVHFEEIKTVLVAATETTPEAAIYWGKFMAAVLDFIIIAFTVFLLVKIINSIRANLDKGVKILAEKASKKSGDETDDQPSEEKEQTEQTTEQESN